MKIDFKFSPEGDLVLGDQMVNAEGLPLYRDMARSEGYTTEVSETSVPIRDVGTAFGDEVDMQTILNRMRTDNPDWLLHEDIGANLSDLIGEPNTKTTMLKGIENITNALLYDGTFQSTEIEVVGAPYGMQEILFFVRLKRKGRQEVRIPLLFNLEQGLVNEYEVEEE